MVGETQLLRATPRTPRSVRQDPDFDTVLGPSTGRRLVCRLCGAYITRDGHRISIEGRHVHRRVNPAAVEFEFGCFGAAEGAAIVGEATAEFSWFAPYTWAITICRSCGAHLGWFFEGGDPRFYALILNRLVEEKEPTT